MDHIVQGLQPLTVVIAEVQPPSEENCQRVPQDHPRPHLALAIAPEGSQCAFGRRCLTTFLIAASNGSGSLARRLATNPPTFSSISSGNSPWSASHGTHAATGRCRGHQPVSYCTHVVSRPGGCHSLTHGHLSPRVSSDRLAPCTST